MKIIKLTAENVKRLKAVEIEPDGTLQVVTGRNAQGKSSVLDAIWLALGGGAASRDTARPIRDGEDTASVTLDLGDIIVTRTWTKAGTQLTVTSPDGAKYSSPQTLLDGLVGRLSFDPLAFTLLSPREQRDALLGLVDLPFDPAELERRRAALYDERTEVGREGKSLAGALAELGDAEEAPDVEVSVNEVVTRLREAQEVRSAHSEAERRAQETADTISRITARIKELEQELTKAQEQADKIERHRAGLTPVPDIDALQAELASVDEVNRAVRRNADRVRLAADADAKRAAYDDLTMQITAIDQEKASGLAAAQFPVDGLGFDDVGVTFGGVPFSQASSAEQIRVSLAMAMASNPKLRVIRIKDGSLLDTESMGLIAGLAKDNDYQVWIERVQDNSEVAIVIEDGSVAA